MSDSWENLTPVKFPFELSTKEMLNAANKLTQSQETSQTQIPNVMENPVPDPSLVEKVAQTQTTEPMTGTQIADKNFNQAVINEQNRAMIQQLNAMKNLYDLAPVGEQGDSWRNTAHNQAEVIRRLARDEGIDLGAWGDGGNISTADSNYALMRDQYQQAKAYQEKFNSVQEDLKNKYAMNSQEYFDDRYDYYRRRGVPHAMAVLRAGQETTPYARERVGFLQNAIDEYGVDGGGVMNQFGVSVLGNLATEDNILGSAYANAYDMPKKLGEYNRAMQTLMATQNAAMERQLERQRADYEKAVMQANEAKKRAELQSNTSMRNTDARIQSDRDIAEYKAKTQMELAEFNAGVQEYLKRLELYAKNGGGNDVTKTGDYKTAMDRLTNARNMLNDLLKENSGATENDIKKAREDMEKAYGDIQDVVDKFNVKNMETIDLESELTGEYDKDLKFIQGLLSQGFKEPQLVMLLTKSKKYDELTARKMVKGQGNPAGKQ